MYIQPSAYKRLFLLLIAGWSFTLPFFAQQEISPDSGKEQTLRKPNYIKSYQTVDKAEVIRQINETPTFAPGKENYLSTGAPLDDEFEKENADAKLQIDLRYRLTRNVMPLHSYLLLNYRQTSFWHVFKKAMDHNINPSIGLTKIVFKGNQIIGSASLMAEHESNGGDSLNYRGWNSISLTGIYFFNPRLHFEGKLWMPFAIGKGNPDLMKYRGYGHLGVYALDRSETVRLSAILNPRGKNDGLNLTLDLSFRLSPTDNKYLFFQYYKGYAEEIQHYSEYHSMLRAGFGIKQDFSSYF